MANWPPLAPVPPPAVQSAVPPQEWELYIDAWILLLTLRIEASDAEFTEHTSTDDSAVTFLTSFYDQLASTGWKYLGSMCSCYPSSSALKKLLSEAWDKHEETISSSLEKAKTAMTKQLAMSSSAQAPKIIPDIRLLTILGSVIPACGQALMAGSDFLDTCYEAYQAHKRDDFRRVLVAIIYVGLTSLLKGPKPNLSLLLDQLFSLKASAGTNTPTTKKEPTLLSDLICSSDLLVRLDRYLISHPQKRGQDLLSSLRAYQIESNVFHHRYQKQKKKLDKGKARAATDLPQAEDMHIHRMSLITQIQDLFPDLGSGYIVRLLDVYDDNPETHDPFPPRPTPPQISSPPAQPRKNVFDKDVDLADLAETDKLRFGRANPDQTADDILADRSKHAVNKAAIMSALATFDSDDDERDDTYDVADVGGTVDATTTDTDADAKQKADELDLTLFRTYKATPALFARDSATRRSQPRASLKRETGMTDEAIEGWAVMLARDSKRLAKLEDRLSLSVVGPGGTGLMQPEIKPTAYRRPGPKGDGESGSETDEPAGSGSRGRGGPSRGRGRGGRRGGGAGRGRGGNAGGGSGDGNTTAQRQRKEENKASRANHNRRQQRAKKVARAGGMMG
ncbi:CUE domain protein [Aspergillus arachidicola]|uniref:CUE domain protein n=1 Tax=Aspergillus arachidicola TaxID=656916 RepID=A0A2G7FEC6_9EURO|nr:CUE domain protein [Aspergillus arachidicola]